LKDFLEVLDDFNKADTAHQDIPPDVKDILYQLRNKLASMDKRPSGLTQGVPGEVTEIKHKTSGGEEKREDV